MSDESPFQLDDDTHLMVKARDGDRSAYEKVYRRHFCTVVAFFARRGGRSQGCEDLAQEVFTRVWHHRSRYEPLAPVKNYLLSIAANVLREDLARFRGRASRDGCDPESLLDTSQTSPPVQMQSAEQAQAVHAVMMRLPARQRQAVELVYLAGLAPEHAARTLGCSTQTLYSHLCAARERLREIVRPTEK